MLFRSVVLLNRGKIEQNATPVDLYERPANTFVARFIGTPPMNLLKLSAAGMIPNTDGPVLGPARAGLIAGIRPESLRLAERGIAARVTHGEYLGADTVLACTVPDGQTLLARLPGRVGLPDGAAVHFEFDQPELHLFDAGTGRRLSTTV